MRNAKGSAAKPLGRRGSSADHASGALSILARGWWRAALLALSAALLARPLTVPVGVAMAALGALVGFALAGGLGSGRLRLWVVVLGAATLGGLGLGVGRLLVSLPLVASLLGPVGALWLAEGLRWSLLAAAVVAAVRAVALRYPTGAVLEVGLVAAAIVASLAAHRDGMVHRPLLLGDWAWSRGLDPAVVLLGLGAVGAVVLAALMLSEERRRRRLLHLAAVAAVALALLLVVRVTGLPKPQPAGDLGLTGEPGEESEDGQGQAGGSSRGDQLRDLPFKDEYSAQGGEAPVAVVLFHDDYSPPSGVYYFRQSAFSQYNGRRLVLATRDDVDRDVPERFPSRALELEAAPPVSSGRAPLPTTAGLLVDHVRPFALDSPARIEPATNPDPLRFRRAFRTLSHVPTVPYPEMLGLRPGGEGWTDAQWRHYTEAPSDPRYRELADRLTSRLRDGYRNDPLAQALAVKGYLDEEGIYSRRSQHSGAGDPTASFLFGDLTGYCVHFAHAAAFLLRSLGVPTRVAAGYAIPEGARGGGSAVMIRGANAHAWPEIHLEDTGWVVVDLAPEQSLDDPVTPPDMALQRMLGEMMRRRGDRRPFEEMLAERWSWRDVWPPLVWALLALIVAAYTVKLYRRGAVALAGGASLYRLGYRVSLDRLGEVGLRRRFGESRERFASRVGSVAPSFTALTGEHLGRSLGSRRLAAPDGLRRLTSEVAAEIRRRMPFWRRLLGALHPWSWWGSR